MRLIGIVLMISGVSIVGYFGYQQWTSTDSVQTIDESIVKESNEGNTHELDSNTEEIDLSNPFDTNENNNDDDQVATLVLPSIGYSYDVFGGTDDSALSKGVGMYDSQWTTSPQAGGHTVLSGHRDNVFRPVGDLEEGDSIYVRYQGEDYQYVIDQIWITDEHDRSVIVEKDSPTLTLTTCYPFTFIGSAPDRYIIQGELVKKGELLNL